MNRATDAELPSLFSPWKEDGKPRGIRRALLGEERLALERRRDETALALAPFGEADADRVALAILDMQNGFGNRDEETAAARVDSTMRLLSGFPAWAIEKACMSIRLNGVWRDVGGAKKYDKRFPPNEPELVDAVKSEAKLYGDTHDRCVALLTAPVEGQPDAR